MFNCFQVSLYGRVIGLFPNNDAADAFVKTHAQVLILSRDDYEVKCRFLPGLPF